MEYATLIQSLQKWYKMTFKVTQREQTVSGCFVSGYPWNNILHAIDSSGEIVNLNDQPVIVALC